MSRTSPRSTSDWPAEEHLDLVHGTHWPARAFGAVILPADRVAVTCMIDLFVYTDRHGIYTGVQAL
jgi:hypothetical protein